MLAAGAIILLAFATALDAQRAPLSYARVAAILPDLWKARYPVAAREFRANPEGLGVLSANDRGRRVYYYHFQALVERPVRGENDQLVSAGERRIELWVRYRPWLEEPWDLSFARRDLLPGQDKRWLR